MGSKMPFSNEQNISQMQDAKGNRSGTQSIKPSQAAPPTPKPSVKKLQNTAGKKPKPYKAPPREQHSINYLLSRSPKMRDLLQALSGFAIGTTALASIIGAGKRTVARWLLLLEKQGLVVRREEANLYLWKLSADGEVLKSRLGRRY